MKTKFLAFVIISFLFGINLNSQSFQENIEDVICTVTTDKEIYTYGENVEITVSIMNTGFETVTVDLTGCIFNYGIDFVYDHIIDEGSICPTLLIPVELLPGESYGQTFIHSPSQYFLDFGEHVIYGNSESAPTYYSAFHFIIVIDETVGTNLFTETFETYTPNQQLCSQNDTLWKPWNGTPGSTNDPFVKNDNPRTGNNSLLIEGLNDAVLLLGDKQSGRYLASFYLMVPEGFTGYYNLLSGFTGAYQPGINAQVFFDVSGLGRVDAGTPNAAFFNYEYDQWNFVENIVDIESDSAWIRINGEDLAAWKWSKGVGATIQWTVRQWAGIDFYAWDDNGTPKYYVDDINFTMLETPACAEITPEGLSFYTPDSLTNSFIIKNTGQSPFSYQINPVFHNPPIIIFDNHISEGGIYNQNKTDIGVTPLKNIQNSILISENKNPYPFSSGAKDNVFVHFDGENAGKLGFTSPNTRSIAVRFPYNRLGEHMLRKLEAVHIYIPDLPSNTFVTICQGYYGSNVPGDTIMHKSFVPIANQWNTIPVDVSSYIWGHFSEEEIWIIYTHTQITTGRSMGFDSGPSNPDGSWYLSSDGWVRFYERYPNYCFNWNIRLELSGEPVWNWLEMESTSGVVEPNSTQEISITAKTDSSWIYPSELCFHTSDPSNPTMTRYVSRTICDSITIQLKSGWNLISTVLNPLPSNPEIVFRDAIANNSLEIVTGFENQQGVIFDPDGPPFLNTLHYINGGAGYWVKVNQAKEITLFGVNYMDWELPIPISWQPIVELLSGWNLMGWRYGGTISPEEAFGSLIDDGVLEMVTSYDGGGLYFNPNGPPFLNTLTEVKHGFGYWIKVSEDCIWLPWNFPYLSE